jgi:hypothetical protein
MGGKITTYNNVATEGYGVPAIVNYVSLTGQNANIGSTNFTNANVAGLYRLSYYLVGETGDITVTPVNLNVSWNDGTGGHSITAFSLVLTGTGGFGENEALIYLGSGSISWSTTHSGTYGTATYGIHMTLEKLN